MEEVDCALCGAYEGDPLFVGKDRLHGIDGVFQLVRCRRCGVVYLGPRPTKEEMGRYYPDEYGAYKGVNGLGLLARLAHHWGVKKKCRAVTGLKERGEILDVGCATGQFLKRMKGKGWAVRGVEVNENAVAYARERLGLDVFAGELEEAGFPEKRFDVVTMWHVLEHLHDPVGTLMEVRRVLKDKGLLIISVPNIKSIEARVFGEFWAGLDIPRHLYVFSPETLGGILERAGFKVIKSCSFFGSYDAFALSTQFVIDEKLRDSHGKAVIKRIIHNPLLRLLLAPYFSLVETLNKASILTAYCVKH